MPTLAILPIKSFDEAKQRLEPELTPGPRRALAEAMFSDVLVALRRARAVDDILVVVIDDPTRVAVIEDLQASLGLHIEIVTTTTARLKAAMARLYGPPIPPDVNVFRHSNILIGPIRDHLVADLVGRGLRGVSVIPPGWQ